MTDDPFSKANDTMLRQVFEYLDSAQHELEQAIGTGHRPKDCAHIRNAKDSVDAAFSLIKLLQPEQP